MKGLDSKDSLDDIFFLNQDDKFNHPQLKFGEVQWAGLDSKELWDKLLKQRYSDNYYWKRRELDVSIKEFNWEEFIQYYTDNPIQYRFNSEGFRDEEWSNKPEEVDVFLGCSFTVGIGLHYEDTWGYKISQATNFPYLNAGVEGSGPITHYRLLLYLAKRFKIRRVYHYFPFGHSRYEWHTLEGWVNLTTGTNFNPKIDFIFSPENTSLLNHLCVNGIKQVCNQNNISYKGLYKPPLFRPNNLGTKKPLIEMIARDWHHSGTDYQEDVANYFIKPTI